MADGLLLVDVQRTMLERAFPVPDAPAVRAALTGQLVVAGMQSDYCIAASGRGRAGARVRGHAGQRCCCRRPAAATTRLIV